MKVKELFDSRTKNDILEIGKIICQNYPERYSTPKEALKNYYIFLHECKKCKKENKNTLKASKFVIFVSKSIEYYYPDDDIPYKGEEKKEIDYDKLQLHYDVGGIDISEFVKKQDIINMTTEEISEKGLTPYTTYDISLNKRSEILNYEIAQLCFDTIDANRIATEIYLEMTYHGLLNKTVKKTIKKLKKTSKEKDYVRIELVSENIDGNSDENSDEEDSVEKDSIEEDNNEENSDENNMKVNDNSTNLEKTEKIYKIEIKNKNTPEALKKEQDTKKINTYGEEMKKSFLKEYYNKYEKTQIQSILEKLNEIKYNNHRKGIVEYNKGDPLVLSQDVPFITQIKIKNCNVSEDFINILLSNFDVEKAHSLDSSLIIHLSNNIMDDATKCTVFSWLCSLYKTYECILDKLVLKGFDFSIKQKKALKYVARHVFIYDIVINEKESDKKENDEEDVNKEDNDEEDDNDEENDEEDDDEEDDNDEEDDDEENSNEENSDEESSIEESSIEESSDEEDSDEEDSNEEDSDEEDSDEEDSDEEDSDEEDSDEEDSDEEDSEEDSEEGNSEEEDNEKNSDKENSQNEKNDKEDRNKSKCNKHCEGIVEYNKGDTLELSQDVPYITQIKIKECNVSEDFLNILLSNFDVEKVHSLDNRLVIDFSNNIMDDATKCTLFSWLCSTYKNYGCILDDLILKGFDFSIEQKKALKNVARHVYILDKKKK